MKKVKKVKELENRLNKLEQRRNAWVDFWGINLWVCLIFVILTPVTLFGYIVASIVFAIIKPFKLVMLSEKEKKYYYLNGQFNELEYMWSSITERYGNPPKKKE